MTHKERFLRELDKRKLDHWVCDVISEDNPETPTQSQVHVGKYRDPEALTFLFDQEGRIIV